MIGLGPSRALIGSCGRAKGKFAPNNANRVSGALVRWPILAVHYREDWATVAVKERKKKGKKYILWIN